ERRIARDSTTPSRGAQGPSASHWVRAVTDGVLCCAVEGGAPIGTEARGAQLLLARLWALLDPAVDALPAAEVLDRLLSRICEQFGVSAAALTLDTGD